MEEKELIIKSQQGDIDAFSGLVKLYQGNIRACLAVRLTNTFEADDLAQETFIVAFRKINDFDSTRPFGPWLRSIAFNLLRNFWHKHKAEPVGHSEELALLVDEHIALNYSERNELNALNTLRECMKKLDESMRRLVELRYHENLPLADLMKKLNINHSTLTMRLHRVRFSLKQCVETNLEGVSS
ncbi:MAG: sigma-70 family RNA polymerase sigma factor [Kiritimatiellae bacterium]|nr:sigma-70 family RNA polymerase sigma factor [Kiritimatiellia bacterium]